MRHQRLLSLAKKLSLKSNHHTHIHGCVIAKGNKVLGTGFNTLKTHPASPHNWKSIHAEFMAVLSANFNVRGATVYVFRQQKDGSPAMSRPCSSCWKYLKDQGVKNVVYTFEGNFKEERV